MDAIIVLDCTAVALADDVGLNSILPMWSS
ncbi:uncharacterized protein METZ01_LOCUS258106 [marine metagenome]|uniref:Uncharacterized protein n=1 Tax=marine metagenome TaxID=408172 RepID=A0A382J1G5_9ZZZZ